MKLRIKRKQTELFAELFNPPQQIPECVFNVYQNSNGFVGEIRNPQNNSITQVIYAGMYIVYNENGSKSIVSKADFENNFELAESSNDQSAFLVSFIGGFIECDTPDHRWISSKVIECDKNKINDAIKDLCKEVTSGAHRYFEVKGIQKVNL